MNHPAAGSGLQDLNPVINKEDVKIESIGFCATPADTFKLKRRASAKAQSIGGMIQQSLLQHQLGISLNLLLLLGMAYGFFPDIRNHLEPFFKLQYPLGSGLFAQGPQDVWIVLACVVVFTGFRALCMDYALKPLAKRCKIKKGKMRQRFAEQAYMMLYYSCFWSFGVYLFVSDTPATTASSFSDKLSHVLASLWRDFPRIGMEPAMKWYYLAQTAFWVQQVLVIHLEERRSDHWQMLTHHFVTIGLLVFSYGFRQMRVGNAILVLMDTVDLVFPLAKCLRYTGMQTACDICFGVFVVSWTLSRHVAYNTILYSIIAHAGVTTMHYGTYSTATSAKLSDDGGSNMLDNLLQPFLHPGAPTVQFNTQIRSVFIGLLGGLQVITLIWFVMIIKVVMRVLSGKGADDSRSDDEDEEEQDVEAARDVKKGPREQKFIEVTADADDLYYAQARPTTSQRIPLIRRASKGISSGLNLGEHKEILNRIGCLSEEQLARERERRKESASPQPGVSKRF